jgi:aminopeptidase-like protein
LAESYQIISSIIKIFEHDGKFLNLSPRGEPQLGRLNLYDGSQEDTMALLWVLNFSDGNFSLLDIAERAKMPFAAIKHAADRLSAAGLLRPLTEQPE